MGRKVMGLEDWVSNEIDQRIAGAPTTMCMFPPAGPLGDVGMLMRKPLPRHFRCEDGDYVLDYEGTFASGYRWEPEPRFDARFAEWYDFGE